MKNTTKAEAKAILTPKQFQAFEESFDKLSNELLNTGTITLDSFVNIIGKIPVIPQSPDMDTMLDAWNEQAEYSKKIMKLESLIVSEV